MNSTTSRAQEILALMEFYGEYGGNMGYPMGHPYQTHHVMASSPMSHMTQQYHDDMDYGGYDEPRRKKPMSAGKKGLLRGVAAGLGAGALGAYAVAKHVANSPVTQNALQWKGIPWRP